LTKALELLKKHAACFQSVCDILEEHLFNPLQNGQRLSMRPPKLGASGSWESKLMEALSGHQYARDDDVLGIDSDARDEDMAAVGEEEVEVEECSGLKCSHRQDERKWRETSHKTCLSEELWESR
jgi:hypothetical protein